MIYLGADHRGFELKEAIKDYLKSDGRAFEDLGDTELNPEDDYPIYAEKVGKKVVEDSGQGQNDGRGIVICGSGAGVDMVANKINGIRCALAFDVERAREAREHDNANVLALPADALESNVALEMVKTFLETPFSDIPRHERRIEEIEKVEEGN
jgi:ribose 5-phosphate isomerase B